MNAGSVTGLPFEPVQVLADGARVRLDLLGPTDRDDLLLGFADLSRRSRYLRFFSAMPRLHDALLAKLLDTDGDHHVAIGARVIGPDDHIEGRIVGVARYYVPDGENDTVEPAVAVVDALHGLGLGRILLDALTRYARAHRVTTMRAHALADNTRIRHILAASRGVLVDRDGPVLIYDVDIRPRRRSTDRASGRDLVAASSAGTHAFEPRLEREVDDGRQIQRQQLRNE
jgi:GNAT superfamily N-acetyltransferase